jgi:hypothetical protein
VLNNGRSKKFALRCCQRTAEGKMEGEKRERWMRLCVEVADELDSNRLLEFVLAQREMEKRRSPLV